MPRHNSIEIGHPSAMWELHDGTHSYIVHGRQPSPHAKHLEIIDCFGSAVVGQSYVYDYRTAISAFSGVTSPKQLIELMSRCRGSLAIHAFDHDTRDYYIIGDPLGGAQIYTSERDGFILISSDLNSHAEVFQSKGKPLTKNFRYFITEILTGTQTHGADTPYEEVNLLRRGEYVRVSRDGHVIIENVLKAESLYFSDIDYNEGLRLYAQEIVENVEISAAAEFETRYSHLTAGFDSRLVLAAIMHAGIQDKFSYYCIPASSDYSISRLLAGHYGLKHSSRNDGNPRSRGYARDYREYVKNAPRASQFALAEGLDFRFSPQNNLVYQGGYGELARTFNSFECGSLLSDPASLAYSLWRWVGFPSSSDVSQSIFTKDYLHEVTSRLASDISAFKELGLPGDYFTNYFYIEKRNRLFIGARSYYASQYRSQFDPLYSSILGWLPAKLNFWHRRENFVGLDAMQYLQPDLMRLPFDKEKIGRLYSEARGKVEPLAYSGDEPSVFDLADQSVYRTEFHGDATEITDSIATAAKKLRIPEIVAHGIVNFWPKAVEAAQCDEAVGSVLSRQNIAAGNEDLSAMNREQALKMHKIISALVVSDVI